MKSVFLLLAFVFQIQAVEPPKLTQLSVRPQGIQLHWDADLPSGVEAFCVERVSSNGNLDRFWLNWLTPLRQQRVGQADATFIWIDTNVVGTLSYTYSVTALGANGDAKSSRKLSTVLPGETISGVVDVPHPTGVMRVPYSYMHTRMGRTITPRLGVTNASPIVLQISGRPPYAIQISTNLVDWSYFDTSTDVVTTIEICAEQQVDLPTSFFRWRPLSAATQIIRGIRANQN